MKNTTQQSLIWKWTYPIDKDGNIFGIKALSLSEKQTLVKFNPFMPNGISHPYQSNLEFKDWWVVIYNFIQILKVQSVSK